MNVPPMKRFSSRSPSNATLSSATTHFIISFEEQPALLYGSGTSDTHTTDSLAKCRRNSSGTSIEMTELPRRSYSESRSDWEASQKAWNGLATKLRYSTELDLEACLRVLIGDSVQAVNHAVNSMTGVRPVCWVDPAKVTITPCTSMFLAEAVCLNLP